MKTLVISENEGAACELCAGARKLAEDVVLVAFGSGSWTGMADTCFHIEVPENHILDDAYKTINAIADEQMPTFVLAEPTVRILSLIGRLAAHFGTAAITDVLDIERGEGRSLYFGGVAQRTVRAKGDLSVFTAGPGTFEAKDAYGTDVVIDVAFIPPVNSVRHLGSEDLVKSDVNLPAAKVVVAAGRGFASEQDLDLARALCAKIDGELGCSRPLTEGVDWMPHEAYIGVSGLMIAPKVYIACGISGQMQHMVGCNRAQTVFAINKDKNAPIFKQCDYGIVGDVETVLPALNEML